jgi:hypothetical protein
MTYAVAPAMLHCLPFVKPLPASGFLRKFGSKVLYPFFSTIFAWPGKNRREKEEKGARLLSQALLSLTKGRRAAEG